MIRNIVVANDGTQVSDKALKVASQIAKPCGACITLLYVIEHIEDPDAMIFGNDKELIKKARLMDLLPSSMKNTWHKSVQYKIKMLDEQNIKSETKCLTGDVVGKILEYAKEQKVDMIVMGSSNRLRGIKKLKALGSVTRKVSELADCPVLIIH